MDGAPMLTTAAPRSRAFGLALGWATLAVAACADADPTALDAPASAARAHQPLTSRDGAAAAKGVLSKATTASRDRPEDWRIVEPVSPSSSSTGTIDHSDILLMLQGCTCISPHCVAYLCPADVVDALPAAPARLGLRVQPSSSQSLLVIEDLLSRECDICLCVKAEGCPCCGYGGLPSRGPF